AKKKRRPLPADHWYYDRPTLPEGVSLFLEAYRDLQTCRAPEGPIPWTAAMDWADRRGLSPELGDVLWGVIWRMDNAERNWRVEAIKSEVGGGAGISHRNQDRPADRPGRG